MNASNIAEKIRGYVLQEYFEDDPAGLAADSPLISSGLIDSISVLQLVDFLEQTFHFEFEAHEIDQSYLNTIDMIVEFVKNKTSIEN